MSAEIIALPKRHPKARQRISMVEENGVLIAVGLSATFHAWCYRQDALAVAEARPLRHYQDLRTEYLKRHAVLAKGPSATLLDFCAYRGAARCE